MSISRDDLQSKIKSISSGYWVPGDKRSQSCEFQKYMAIYDPFYEIPTQAEVEQFLEAAQQARSSENTQNLNIWDCDQHARYLWVEAAKYVANSGISNKWASKWALGMISGNFMWVGPLEDHTCNWVYMAEGFKLIEPQNFSFHNVNEIVKTSIRLIIV